jgi:predicted transcriptional regulator of viral defense system
MSPEDTITRYLSQHGPTPVADLKDLGLSRAGLFRVLERLLDQGQIIRIRRGVYQIAEGGDPSDTWVQVMRRYPRGVLCLLSALAFHEITTQSPSVVWLALPKSAWRKPQVYPPLRIVHFSNEAYAAGIETHKSLGGIVRVYSVAKTVADCFKFRNRVGLDVAIEALRDGWRQRHFALDELAKMARICRVQAVMRPYVEALVHD